jgi:hypothetical protein
MRLAAAALLLSTIGCSASFLQPYEYEEEMYLSLDRSATVYVHASLAALNTLRGASFEMRSGAGVDREAVARYFTSPVTRVARDVKTSRRSGREFVHVEVEVNDVHRLGEAPPFAWSSYRFGQEGEVFVFRQTISRSTEDADNREHSLRPVETKAAASTNPAAWSGEELVAFRVHVPSKVVYHNAGEGNLRRGNILVWEQPLGERLEGTPVEIEARMETQSILYRTLWLFAGTIVAAALAFAVGIWWIVRRGASAVPQTGAT